LGWRWFFPCVVLAMEADKVKSALSSAETWLSFVDEGKYADTWNEAAGYFKGAVKQEQWQEMLKAVRKPLGKVISREVKSKSYHTSLPGAPDGEYVVIQFDTSFENKKSAIETVTPMKDKDGKWRVSGYFIK
jgi:ribosomal protein S17E